MTSEKNEEQGPSLELNGEKETIQSSLNWKSCCFTFDSRAVLFFVQVLFSAFMMGFAANKLNNPGPPDPLWVSIMTSMIGIWLPSPTLIRTHPPGLQPTQ